MKEFSVVWPLSSLIEVSSSRVQWRIRQARFDFIAVECFRYWVTDPTIRMSSTLLHVAQWRWSDENRAFHPLWSLTRCANRDSNPGFPPLVDVYHEIGGKNINCLEFALNFRVINIWPIWVETNLGGNHHSLLNSLSVICPQAYQDKFILSY